MRYVEPEGLRAAQGMKVVMVTKDNDSDSEAEVVVGEMKMLECWKLEDKAEEAYCNRCTPYALPPRDR